MTLPTICPKCQRERKLGEEACAQCGLLLARWAGFVANVPSLEPVDKAWDELGPVWAEDTAHRKFVELAAAFDGLDVAAARYREVLRARPGDPQAKRGLEQVVVLATQKYATPKPFSGSDPLQSRTVRLVSLVLAGLLLAFAVAAAMRLLFYR